MLICTIVLHCPKMAVHAWRKQQFFFFTISSLRQRKAMFIPPFHIWMSVFQKHGDMKSKNSVNTTFLFLLLFTFLLFAFLLLTCLPHLHLLTHTTTMCLMYQQMLTIWPSKWPTSKWLVSAAALVSHSKDSSNLLFFSTIHRKGAIVCYRSTWSLLHIIYTKPLFHCVEIPSW